MINADRAKNDTKVVAIASGKGGTGKTTLATNLAYLASQHGRAVAYLDCDVEEPNGHIFLKPVIAQERLIEKRVPVVDDKRCVYCGACSEVCQYGAIASLPEKTLVFPELCHACGGCELACGKGAIREELRSIGRLRLGTSDAIHFVDGVLNVGEAMSPPAIHAVKEAAPAADLVILDAPPGVSCPVIETLQGCDLVLLVTEPTPFGFYDLTLAVEMVRAMELPFAVVINRSNVGNEEVRHYCTRHQIPILAEIPDSRAVAVAYSRGQMICGAVPEFARRLEEVFEKIMLEKVE